MTIVSFDSSLTAFGVGSYTANSSIAIGQVAQLVERGPEKAGVGGSIPSLATIIFNNLRVAKNRRIYSREQYANIAQAAFALSPGSSNFHICRAVLLVLAMCCLPSLA